MKTLRIPNGPGDRLLGVPHIWGMRRNFLKFFSNLHRLYGDAVHMRILGRRYFSFFHPDLIREVLVDNGDAFVRWETGIRIFTKTHGLGVLTSEGDVWRRQRRFLQPVFSTRTLADFAKQVASAADAALEKLPVGVPFRYGSAMGALAVDVILGSMFRNAAQFSGSEVDHAVTSLAEAAYRDMFMPVRWPDWLPFPTERGRHLAMLRRLIGQCVADRRQHPGGYRDWVSLLLEGQGRDSGQPDEQEIFDQAITLFLTRHETTVATLEWIGWVLASRPALAARAAGEVDAVLEGRMPGYDDIAKLPVLGQMIRETMRLYPVAPALFMRQAVRDVEIGGWDVPKGSFVALQNFEVHRDPRWHPDPDRFDIDRFAPENTKRIARGAYFPFGMGPRACVGMNFALMELTIVYALLLQRFELRLAHAQTDPGWTFTVALRPERPVEIVLTRRVDALNVNAPRVFACAANDSQDDQ